MPEPTKICFVCLGNIVRSPFAENLFRHLTKGASLEEKYRVDSAGTSAYHVGEEPDRRMRQVAAQHGFHYTGKARQFEKQDFETFDWIIAMDDANRRNLLRMSQKPEHKNKIHMMRSFDPLGSASDPVPDPYYGGIDGFEVVYQILERSIHGLLEALENGELK